MAPTPSEVPPIAYSGIAAPLRVLTAGAESVAMSEGSGNKTYTLTVPDKAIIQGIQASINNRALTFTGGAGSLRMYVKRDNKLLASSSVNIGYLVDTIQYASVLFYETLGSLAGAEVYQGEVWEIGVENSLGSGSTVTLDITLNIVVRPVGATFY